MPTGLSLTELRSSRKDLGALLLFRSSGLSEAARRRLRVAGGALFLLTVAAVVGPAHLAGEAPREYAGSVLALLPSMCLGFLVLAVFTAVASAGGREVVPREQRSPFPSPPPPTISARSCSRR